MTEVASVLYGREDVRRRVEELGRTITGDYVGREPVLLTVLTGGAVFLADLIRAVDLPVETHFMAISRYGNAEESFGRVQILLDVEGARAPASLEICTLLDRSVRRIVPLVPSYVGFDCPDTFVVGYGLDYRERYRNLPDILRVDDLAALRSDPDVLAPLLTDAAA